MKVLVTGNKGFIGTYVQKFFEDLGYEVIGCDLKDNGLDVNYLTNYYTGDIDMIVHCASFCFIRECIKDPEVSFVNNVSGTYRVFEFARMNGIKKIIYFSSSRVLENESNVYTASKKYGEDLAKAYKQCYGINYIIIRPSTVYGDGDTTDRIVPRFIRNALENKDIIIYGDKHKTLDLTYIKDFMKAFNLILFYGGWNNEYNISNKIPVSIQQLSMFIRDTVGSKSQIKYERSELAQPQQVCVDNTDLQHLGYKLSYSWEDGILQTIKWMKENETGKEKTKV